MKQPLSDKQYITTKARSLPIDSCSINSEWRESGLAHVKVTRRHVTGKVTGAIFMVDLHCLGVKDAYYFFNEEPDFLDDRMEEFGIEFVEIDYTLAHNIVYAGHDYAMEFDIRPHKDFAIARYILEEDDDRIPLIDIETGYMGKPLLHEEFRGEYSEARAKLEKHLGPDGYHYMVDGDLPDDEDGEEDEDEDFEGEINIDDIPRGLLSPYDVALLPYDVLTDADALQKRQGEERSLMLIESVLRLIEDEYEDLNTIIPELGIDETGVELAEQMRDDVDAAFVNAEFSLEGITAEQFTEEIQLFRKVLAGLKEEPELSADVMQKHFELQANAHRPVYLCQVALASLLDEDPEAFLPLVLEQLTQHRHILLVALTQSFIHMICPEVTKDPWCSTEHHVTPVLCFPGRTRLDENERTLFYASKTIQYARQRQLLAMTASYRAMAAEDAVFLTFPLWVSLGRDVLVAIELFLQRRMEKMRGNRS